MIASEIAVIERAREAKKSSFHGVPKVAFDIKRLLTQFNPPHMLPVPFPSSRNIFILSKGYRSRFTTSPRPKFSAAAFLTRGHTLSCMCRNNDACIQQSHMPYALLDIHAFYLVGSIGNISMLLAASASTLCR